VKYAVEQRLRFIDFLIDQYGHINRTALTDYFGISVPQASNDMAMYTKIAPDNVRYSNNEKTYKKNPEFKRIWK